MSKEYCARLLIDRLSVLADFDFSPVYWYIVVKLNSEYAECLKAQMESKSV